MLYALIAATEDMENYGDEERPYWKCKGGREEVILTDLSVAEAWEIEYGFRHVDDLVRAVEINNSMFTSWVVGTYFIPMTFIKNGRMDYDAYYDALYNDGEMGRIKEEVRRVINGHKDFAACNPPAANENVMPNHRLVLDWWEGSGAYCA